MGRSQQAAPHPWFLLGAIRIRGGAERGSFLASGVFTGEASAAGSQKNSDSISGPYERILQPRVDSGQNLGSGFINRT